MLAYLHTIHLNLELMFLFGTFLRRLSTVPRIYTKKEGLTSVTWVKSIW